jgi:hypothetical protein
MLQCYLSLSLSATNKLQRFPIAMSAISFSAPSSSYSFPRRTTPPRVTLPIRISCGPNPTRFNKKITNDQSETQELVRLLTRKISEKEPLLKTLNKYVKVVRTEHCFLLFEEFGKHDKWLQCLEVTSLSLYPLFSIYLMIHENISVLFINHNLCQIYT